MSGKPTVATVPPIFTVRLAAIDSGANRPTAFNKARSFAIAPFVHSKLPLGPCGRPVFTDGHQSASPPNFSLASFCRKPPSKFPVTFAALCRDAATLEWGARPSWLPFSASRQKPFPRLNSFTSSLIPAFSPRRRRNAASLAKPTTGLEGPSFANASLFSAASADLGKVRAGICFNLMACVGGLKRVTICHPNYL